MALGLFGSRVRPGGRGGIYSTMDGLGGGPAAASFTVTPKGATYNAGGMQLVTKSQAALDQLVQQQNAAAAQTETSVLYKFGMSPKLYALGIALGVGFYWYRHHKKKGG